MNYYHSNPIMLTFIDMLYEIRKQKVKRESQKKIETTEKLQDDTEI